MTNRDYLRELSNERIAELIWSGGNDKICEQICEHMAYDCDGYSCTECITKWLEEERKSDVKKGQIRQADSEICFLILMVINTECLIASEKGTIYKRPKSVVDTWTIRNDISIDEFTERIFNNL